MLKDKDGNRLFRKMTVKIIFPDGIFPERTYTQHAGPHQGFGPDGVHQMLDDIATKLDELYPWWDFRPVELTPDGRTTRWVFTFAGYRDTTPAPVQPIADSKSLESGLPEDITELAIKEAVGTILQETVAQMKAPSETILPELESK